MAYKFEDELRKRAGCFVETLAEAGIEAAIVPGSFRDYMVKVSVSRSGRAFGHVNLYYSPKKNRFSLKTHELKDKSIVSELQACWDSPPVSDPTDRIVEPTSTEYQIYVDGSCLGENVGYGLVVIKANQVVDELYGPMEEEAVQGMRQVAGELRAAQEAILWCQTHNVPEVSLFYDYEGIKKWATDAWRANKPATQAYAQAAQEWSVVVHWHKVDSHTGNRWNDYADQLAKRGASQRQQIPQEEQQDLIDEVYDKTSGFVEFLVQQGIASSFRGLINNQFARVIIGSKQGIFDVYNSRKRPISDPYAHSFRDPSLKSQIEGLWQEFLYGSKEDEHPEDGNLLRQASYYYEILKPYRECEFDFVDLAEAIHKVCIEIGHPANDIGTTRYDFVQLERLYVLLKGEEI